MDHTPGATEKNVMFDLSGQVAIVTGASRGIGEAIARRLTQAGAAVAVMSRKQENVDAAAHRLRETGGRVIAIAGHAGSETDVVRVVQTTVAELGRIDIVVNNAAVNPHFGPLLTAETSHWDKTFEVNVKGAFFMARAVAPIMKQQGGGKIINVASIAGLNPGPMMGVYSVSKAALIMLTKALAVELAADNIQVNAIAPGFIKTRFSSALWGNPDLNQAISRATPAGRIAEPEEVAGAALYLASPASSFTTGSVLVVDGGVALGVIPLG
jgi:NAD(P)-dependent dehydrogenase (short-subunit alcohol dehydrogenase family)